MNSDSKIKEGVCYFLKSRLPTAEGTVNGRKVEVLRDTGCTCCTVKRSLVSDDQLIGKESYCPPPFRRKAEGHCFRLSEVRSAWCVVPDF